MLNTGSIDNPVTSRRNGTGSSLRGASSSSANRCPDQTAAAMVDGAELIVYPDGGHIWIGRGKEMFDTIAAFIDRIAGNPTNGQ